MAPNKRQKLAGLWDYEEAVMDQKRRLHPFSVAMSRGTRFSVLAQSANSALQSMKALVHPHHTYRTLVHPQQKHQTL
jgi:hypothetical protein